MEFNIIGTFIIGILIIIFCRFLLYLLGEHGKRPNINLREVTPVVINKLRGKSYSEILLFFINFNQLQVNVAIYNDTNHEKMSHQQWETLDLSKIRQKFNCQFTKMNGPRYWCLDEVVIYQIGDTLFFNNFKFALVANIFFPIWELIQKFQRKPYTVIPVSRKTKYTFYSGSEVYELIDDKGRIYIMQAASKEVIKESSFDILHNLANNFKLLPNGWKYRVRVVEANEVYSIDGIASMIQDEFFNTYQRIE